MTGAIITAFCIGIFFGFILTKLFQKKQPHVKNPDLIIPYNNDNRQDNDN